MGINVKKVMQSLDRPRGFQETKSPRFQENRHMNAVRLAALRTSRLYPPGNIPGAHFCQRLSLSHGRAAGRIMSMTTSEIEPATCRLVAECLNQLRHCVLPYIGIRKCIITQLCVCVDWTGL